MEQRFFSPVGLNFYVGSSKSSMGTYTNVPGVRDDLIGHHSDAISVAEAAAGHPLMREEVSGYWFGKAFEYIKKEPASYALLLLRKVGLLLTNVGHGLPEEYRVWRWYRPVLSFAIVDYGLILALSLAGAACAWSRRYEPGILFLVVGGVLYALTLVVFFVGERYRLPLILLMLPFAARGLSSLFERGRRIQFTAFSIPTYLLTIYLASLVLPQIGWANDVYAVRQQELAKAQRVAQIYRWRESVSTSGRNADVWVSLARDALNSGLSGDAVTMANLAIRRQPGKANGYWVLYSKLQDKGPKEGFQRLLDRVAAARPDDTAQEQSFVLLRAELNRRIRGEALLLP